MGDCNGFLSSYGDGLRPSRYITAPGRGPILDFPPDPRRMLCTYSESDYTSSSF